MTALELRPFADEHLDGAARVLAARHARHRAAEQALPEIDDFRAQVAAEWSEDVGGAVALRGGDVVGYLVGRRREDQLGPHLWSHVAGHAVAEPDLARDLYGVAAARWVEEGLTRHFVFVPALDDLVEPWFRLSFGASAALAMRETAPEEAVDADVTIRPSTPDDLEAAAVFDRLLSQVLTEPPSFSGFQVPDLEACADEWRDTWTEEEFEHFVAERDGRVVGHALLYRRPAGDLRVPPGSIDLANCATDPSVRGSGAGLALTAHVLRWAHEHGHATMTTDWRMTNLVASRFWPRRGFRETFLRVYRSIP